MDDIEIRDGECPHYADCDFEDDDFCLWEKVYDKANIQWIINNGATPTFGTGPSVDHTFGTPLGRYIYLKSIGIDKEENARIKSFVFEPVSQSTCFEFWYHMLGNNIHSLNVYQYLDGSQKENLIWTLKGDQGDKWNRATVPISSSERFYLIIEGFADNDELRYVELFINT